MSARVTVATARRVLRQIRRDRRTVAVPTGLLVMLRFVFDGRPGVFQFIGARCVASSRSS